jgi:hypothetical protein
MAGQGQQGQNQSPPGFAPATIGTGIKIVAVVLIVIWLGVMWWLGFYHVKEDEVYWTRLTFLFNSLEAVVFAAAGALFGTQVQRARVEKAESVAKKGVKLASLVKGSSSDMRSVFDIPELNIVNKGAKAASHGQMEQLADDILEDATN